MRLKLSIPLQNLQPCKLLTQLNVANRWNLGVAASVSSDKNTITNFRWWTFHISTKYWHFHWGGETGTNEFIQMNWDNYTDAAILSRMAHGWHATHGLMYINGWGFDTNVLAKAGRCLTIIPREVPQTSPTSSLMRFEASSRYLLTYYLTVTSNQRTCRSGIFTWKVGTMFPLYLLKQKALALPWTVFACLQRPAIWIIHRNLDITRQDVQKAAVAACTIAGFW